MVNSINVDWNRSRIMFNRLDQKDKIVYKNNKPFFKGSYQGKEYEVPIITRDSPILGGVCLGGHEREAFFVGNQSYALNDLKEKVEKRSLENGFVKRSKILGNIYNVVTENLPYDSKKVDEIIKRNGKKDNLISLGNFIRNNAGICRHQAVTCGALMEMFGEDRELKWLDSNLRGKSSINRNHTPHGAHAWARYECNDGSIVIMDVAQKFIDVLDSKETQEKINKGILWPYNKPDDSFFFNA